MLTTTHLVSGAVVGVVLRNPLLIAPTSLAIHYVLDSVPHYAPSALIGFKESGLKGVSWLEMLTKGIEPVVGFILTGILILLVSPTLRVPIAIGAIFGWLPDLIHFLDWKYDIKQPKFIKFLENRFHMTKLHIHTGGLKGFLPQSFLTIFCLLFLIAKIK